MRGLISLIGTYRITALLISFLMVFAASTGFTKETESITILYTGNLNGYLVGCNCPPNPVGGFEKMATVVERLKLEKSEEHGTPPLLLDTGDIFDKVLDSLLSELLVDGYKLLGYDAVAVGNNELTQGIEALYGYRGDIPLMVHNIGFSSAFYGEKTDGQSRTEDMLWIEKPYTVIRNDLTIGIISLIERETVERDFPFLEVRDPNAVLEGIHRHIEPFDLIVLLYHGGERGVQNLVQSYPWIDVAIPDNDGGRVFPKKANSTIIVSPSKNGDDVGVLDIRIKNGDIIDFDNRFYPVVYEAEETNPSVQVLIERYIQELVENYSVSQSSEDSGLFSRKVPDWKETEVVLKYYYSPGCSQCRKFIETTVPMVEKTLGISLVLTDYDIFETEHFESLTTLLGINNLSDISLPVLYFPVTGDILQGEKEINRRIQTAVVKAANAEERNTEDADYIRERDRSGSFSSPVNRLSAVPVFFAGLIDGVNPCAFVTLLFLISALTVAGKTRREIFITGIFFTSAVFLSYFLIGLGLFTALYRLEAFPIVAAIIRYALVVILFCLAGLSLYDYFQVKRGKPESITLQLPKSFKRRIHNSIRTRKYVVSIGGAAFVLGILVSLFELACTGQIYFPTIAYMIKTDSPVAGIYYLLLYNFGFIIPLAAVFILTYVGIGSEKLVAVFNRNLGTVKLLTMGVFIFFAFAMILLV